MAKSLQQDLYNVSVQGLGKRCPGKTSARSQKISMQCLCAKSLYETSVQALWKSSLGKIYVRDLMARSLYRSLEEVCRQDLLDKISIPRTDTLCEPAQSKCTSTFHKSHVLQGRGLICAHESDSPAQWIPNSSAHRKRDSHA